MKTCLKYCTPIAAAMFVGAAVWTYSFPGGIWIKQSTPIGAVREGAFAGDTVPVDLHQITKTTASNDRR